MSLVRGIETFAKLAVGRADGVGRAVAQETGRRLIDRSPVGTGHFRANWQFGVNAAPMDELPVSGKAGSPEPAPPIPEIAPAMAGRRFYWVNNTAYGRALEEGRDGRRPLGLTALAEIEFPAIVAEAASSAS